jgi:hypothetical protein
LLTGAFCHVGCYSPIDRHSTFASWHTTAKQNPSLKQAGATWHIGDRLQLG